MTKLNLRAYDLNLLPILDALLDEKSVSLAAERVNLTQSATSSALTRLRETLKDPVLVRQAQRMIPSARAMLVRDRLKASLATIRDIISEMRDEHDGERRQVKLCAPEHIQLTLLTLLRSLMTDVAQDTAFTVLTLDQREMIEALENAAADIAIGSFGSLPDTFMRRKLYKESIVVVMRQEHPALARAADGRMTMADLVAYPHLVVSTSADIRDTILTKWLVSKSVKRTVGAVIQHIAMTTEILRNSDSILLGTERSFAVAPDSERWLAKIKLPIELTPDIYFVEMIWHNRTERDPVLRDVRQLVHGYCQTV